MRTDEIAAVAARYARRFPEDAPAVGPLLDLAAGGADLASRSEFRGHATCGALVLGPDGRVLLIHHRALDRWLLPGGHLEPGDATLREAALRELAEETGIPAGSVTGLAGWPDDMPVHIDCHSIPANALKREPPHRHWDFRFAFRGRVTASTIQEEEVWDWAWAAPELLPAPLAARLRSLRLLEPTEEVP